MSEVENKAIVLNGVTKSFGEKRVLDNFSASFPYGSKTVVKGVSGCGKTTILRLLAGRIRRHTADIFFPGFHFMSLPYASFSVTVHSVHSNHFLSKR